MARLGRIGIAIVMLLAIHETGRAEGVRLRPLATVSVEATGSPLDSPRGVGCADSTLIVADSGNGRVLLYAVDESDIRASKTYAVVELPRPVHVEKGPDGKIFVLDGKRRKIGCLDAAGQFDGYIEPADDRAGFAPRSFRIGRDGALWVLDARSASVKVLDRSGAVTRTIALPGDSIAPADLTLDSRGTVYVIDSVKRRVYAAGSDAGELTALGESLDGKVEFPTAIVADDRGRLFVADTNGGSIVILGSDGTFRGRHSGFGWKDGLLRYPSGICLDATGRLFVADRGNDRVQVFSIVQ